MAPALKRSQPQVVETPTAKSTPKNSIIVAGTNPVPAGKVQDTPSSDTESAHSNHSNSRSGSPAAEADLPDTKPRTGNDKTEIPIRASREADDMDTDVPHGHNKPNTPANHKTHNGTFLKSITMPPPPTSSSAGPVGHRDGMTYQDYEFSDIEEITVRQLNEDIVAYRYDLDYCEAHLRDDQYLNERNRDGNSEDDDGAKVPAIDPAAALTPQEARTLQLRCLDLGHQIRYCTHRIEMIKARTRRSFGGAGGSDVRNGGLSFSSSAVRGGDYGRGAPAMESVYSANGLNGPGRQNGRGGGYGGSALPTPGRRTPSGGSSSGLVAAGKRTALDDGDHLYHGYHNNASHTNNGGAKRVRMSAGSPEMDMPHANHAQPVQHAAHNPVGEEGVNTALQRLGFWKCRLCSAPKYLLAGAGRTPAAPCKWPLKDISKMITHFTEMHGEHTPAERCAELGAALAQNRGPFEYWLRRTRAQNISDGGIIDDCFDTLFNGEMPELLRRHSRAAAGMPGP
ncbi:hypothetical protein B0J18DRAFT_282982 [Chaetomium sp. MPI-SDFR-AT-0129]|nr:hypothetical protein B0J18DRAFT_282982 [Chaetomium sp. MPI-SDFR-AT-0129]